MWFVRLWGTMGIVCLACWMIPFTILPQQFPKHAEVSRRLPAVVVAQSQTVSYPKFEIKGVDSGWQGDFARWLGWPSDAFYTPKEAELIWLKKQRADEW